MSRNILQNELEVTLGHFADSVFGDKIKKKPFKKAALSLLFGIFRSGSTLVSDIVRALNPDELEPPKELRERCSEWLEQRDFTSSLNLWMKNRFLAGVKLDDGIAFDNSDISKIYGGEGMEGMEMGHDGSRSEPHMGHLFAAATLVPSCNVVPKPAYVKLQKGKHGPLDLLKTAISTVMTATESKPIGVIDREADAADFIWWCIEKTYRMVIRVRHMKRDVAGTGQNVAQALSDKPWRNIRLKRLSGDEQPAAVRHMVVQIDNPDKPKKNERSEFRNLLLVESRFHDKSLYFYVTLPESEFSDPAQLAHRAEQAAQLYMNRWQIEISFLRVKQDFGLEKARVRTFKRLENLLFLCYLCHIFTHFVLHGTDSFGKIVKVVKDNFRNVCLGAVAILGNIRALLGLRKVRFMTGRPPGRRRGREAASCERQLLFSFV